MKFCTYSWEYDEELCDYAYVENDSVVVDFDFGASSSLVDQYLQ